MPTDEREIPAYENCHQCLDAAEQMPPAHNPWVLKAQRESLERLHATHEEEQS